METYITTKEAAKIAGTTSATILNLCHSGVLKYKKQKRFFYPSKKSLEEHLEKVREIHEVSADIEELRDKLFHERVELKDELNQLQKQYHERMANIDMFPKRIAAIRDFLYAVLQNIEPYLFMTDCELTPRQFHVLWDTLQGKSFDEIGEKFSISRESIRQIWEKGLRRIMVIKRHSERLNDTIEELKVVIAEKDKEIARLKCELSGETFKLDDEVVRISKILAINLLDEDLSVRCRNGLKYFNIQTVRDLLGLHRTDMLKARNFGKKSLNELDDILYRYGVEFGMNVNMYPEYSEVLEKQSQNNNQEKEE